MEHRDMTKREHIKANGFLECAVSSSASNAGADEPVAESPYYLRVAAAEPQPRKCTVTGQGFTRAVPGVEAEFYVEAKDIYSNRCGCHTNFIN